MAAEDEVTKSPLDKPLSQLTEDDISQLTREDCRRYLKQKGMRRPSWNKSQAIQQVISLKKLLEMTTSDSDARPLYIPHRQVEKGVNSDAEISQSAKQTAPHCGRYLDKPNVSSDLSAGRAEAAVSNNSGPTRTDGIANIAVGQMTIFYCGKVNVYDDIPADKAQEIMHIAASSLHLYPETPASGIVAPQYLSCPLQDIPRTLKVGFDSSMVHLPNVQREKMNDSCRRHGEDHEDSLVEGHSNRKVLVQRYREKRKDRFKSKRKVGIASSATLDIYANQQMGSENPFGNTKRSSPCSPPLTRPPDMHGKCSVMDRNDVKNASSESFNDRD